MEIITKLSEHWLEIAVAVYVLVMVLQGYYRGFIRVVVSATAMLITLVTVNYTMPYVTDWLKHDTPVYETLKDKMTESIGIDDILNNLGLEKQTQKADEWLIIEELPLPNQLKDLLVENNNIEVYRMMGVEFFRDYIIGYLADTILKASVFVVLFILIYIALKVLVIWLDLIAKLPIISGINKTAGAILGGIQALLFIWILCIVLTIFVRTEIGGHVFAQVNASPWLSWLYNHNVLANLVLGLIRSIW